MKKFILTFITLTLACSISMAQNTAKIHSIFIYNFIKLIEWPPAYKSGTFNIAVLADDPIYQELVNLSKVKKAGVQTIQVTKINDLGSMGKTHVVYIPKSKAGQISNAKAKVGGNPTLVISDTNNGTEKGADINFVIVNNKPKFEISPSQAQAKGLKISSNLLNLGITK